MNREELNELENIISRDPRNGFVRWRDLWLVVVFILTASLGSAWALTQDTVSRDRFEDLKNQTDRIEAKLDQLLVY